MRLFVGGFGKYSYYTVAKDEEAAIANIQAKDGMCSLPVSVQAIDDIDNYDIVPRKKKTAPKDQGETNGQDNQDQEGDNDNPDNEVPPVDDNAESDNQDPAGE